MCKTGHQDASMITKTGQGDCRQNECIDNVVNGDDGTSCSKCGIQYAKGTFTGDLSQCGECDVNFKSYAIGESACQCINPKMDPASRCTKCQDGFGGPNCQYDANDCNGRGKPTDMSTASSVACECTNMTTYDGKTIKLNMDAKSNCDKCEKGWGPEPGDGVDFPCSVRSKYCELSPDDFKGYPDMQKLVKDNPKASKVSKTSRPGKYSCDISDLNALVPPGSSTVDAMARGKWYIREQDKKGLTDAQRRYEARNICIMGGSRYAEGGTTVEVNVNQNKGGRRHPSIKNGMTFDQVANACDAIEDCNGFVWRENGGSLNLYLTEYGDQYVNGKGWAHINKEVGLPWNNRDCHGYNIYTKI